MIKFLLAYKRKIVLIGLIGFTLIAVLDKTLAVGLAFLIFLCLITFLILWKTGIKDKKLYLALLIILIIHLGVALFIYYTDFRPFGEGAGDYDLYNKNGIEIAKRFSQGNFSLQGLRLSHYYSVFIGFIYIFTLPDMLVGQMFSVWLTLLTVIFTYLIVLEISNSKKWAFLMSLIICFYPSYVYFGSLLLKDTIVIPFVLIALFFSLKLINKLSFKYLLIFYVFLTILTHLRFYIGYAVLFSFIISWFLISNFGFKKRIIYGIAFIIILGFSPQFLGYGYYGIKTLNHYINIPTITSYREVVYAPSSVHTEKKPDSSVSGVGSSFLVETGFENPPHFVLNYFKSFIYSLLGPFPWQIRYLRQSLSLLETIPWYFLILVFFFSLIKSVKQKGLIIFKKYKPAIPFLIFTLLSFGALSLFITNFGIILRIRIPNLMALLCIFPLSINYDWQQKN